VGGNRQLHGSSSAILIFWSSSTAIASTHCRAGIERSSSRCTLDAILHALLHRPMHERANRVTPGS
jgi:hypothetical protein